LVDLAEDQESADLADHCSTELACPDQPVLQWDKPLPPAITPPEVTADRTVTFRILAPDTKEVQLSGEWMGPTPAQTSNQDHSPLGDQG